MNPSDIIFQIIIEFLNTFSLVAGILGIFLFAVMLRSLQTLKIMGKTFNRTFSLKRMERGLNRKMGQNLHFFLISHPHLFGFFLSLISFILILVFSFKIQPEALPPLFHISQEKVPVLILFFQTLKLLGLISLTCVFVFGLLLVFRKELAEKFCITVDRWYNIDDSIENKLEETISKDIDTISFLMNKSIGWTGLVLSLFLVLLSLYNLLKMV